MYRRALRENSVVVEVSGQPEMGRWVEYDEKSPQTPQGSSDGTTWNRIIDESSSPVY